MNQSDTIAAERECAPGQLMRLVAGGLTAHGFEVHSPEYDDERRLTITGLKDIRCWIIVDDDGHVECEYVPQCGREADPAKVASLVMNRLASDRQEPYCTAGKPRAPGLPLMCVVGRELKAAGLDVGMNVYPDLDDYDVVAEIVVTNPGHRERGKIRISGDGAITWERDYGDGNGASSGDIAETAETVASILTHEIAGISTAAGVPQPHRRAEGG
jgi:hypothetical protein